MNLKRILVALLLVVTAFTLVACPGSEPTYEDVETGYNDTYTLVLQSSTMDGVFNPFFYSSAYDGDVIGLTNVGLLTVDPTGAVVAGDDYPVAALDYSIFYTNNLTTYAEKETYAEGDYVVYEMTLKNGDKFSDGNPITADDVLFNYYVYLDPAYNGSSTLYTLPILGLNEYRTQTADLAAVAAKAAKILEDDGRKGDYVATAEYTEAEFDAYWTAFNQAGALFCQEIVTYVMSKYATNAYVNTYFSETLTADQIKASATLQVAYGMGMWGYGEISTDSLTFTGASGTVYQVADLTADVYFAEMMLANEDELGVVDYQGVSDYESAGGDFVSRASELFTIAIAEEGSVPTIAGLVKGTKTVGGVEYETLKVILTEQNPKAILSLGVTVTPKHYYTAGYTYPAGALKNYGVQWNSEAYMAHLATFNGDPRGAGPYTFIEVNDQDGTVYFERNEYFDTLGGDNVFNSYIKKVALKIVDSGAEYAALEADAVHYATVSATADVMTDIGAQEKLVSVLVDNLGYGYICINPQVYPDMNVRIALASLMDVEKIKEYYPNGLADVIYRSQSQVSWAYPEGAEAIYPFDGTKATAIARLKAAGYTFNETTQQFTDVPETLFKFTIPSAAEAHPAGGVFLRAQALLAEIGITATVVTDTSLIANIKKAPVGVYALAWQSTQDPDMYQVYHYLSQADSVIANGIQWLYANGDDDDLGTISVTKLDNTVVEMNQKEALAYLGELIEQGTKYMLAEERAPIYAKALEVLAQLNIELPTYQRKNLFVYNGDIIDGTTLSTTVTPYWGPMAEIWKVQFVEGTTGNLTEKVEVTDAE